MVPQNMDFNILGRLCIGVPLFRVTTTSSIFLIFPVLPLSLLNVLVPKLEERDGEQEGERSRRREEREGVGERVGESLNICKIGKPYIPNTKHPAP